MDKIKKITAATPEEAWKKVEADLKKDQDLLEYKAVIEQGKNRITFVIDIDPGGGFESGISTTMLSASLQNDPGFKFAIHHEGFLDEIGKFFGMQDINIGYPEFDKAVIIKTNDEARVKKLFSTKGTREVFKTLHNYKFFTEVRNNEQPTTYLVLMIDEGITDTKRLKDLFSAFNHVLAVLDRG